jgi:hypothetical protein
MEVMNEEVLVYVFWGLIRKRVDKVAVPKECGRESRLSELGGNALKEGRDRERDPDQITVLKGEDQNKKKGEKGPSCNLLPRSLSAGRGQG